MQFENPIVETEYSLNIRYKNFMKENRDILVFDMGENISIYKHYINAKTNIEHWMAKDFLKNHLTNITNAYKQFDERIIEIMLQEEAEKIQRIAKGSVLTNQYLNYCIDEAKTNKDTIEIEYNSSIRFLTNPYYIFKNEDYPNRESIKSKLRNKYLGNIKTSNNHKLIYNCISDHDCNEGQITKKSLSNSSNLSLRTINNYLKKYPVLNVYFNEVRELSASDKQINRKKYNKSLKLLKRAS
jgi:hypothetical protein